MSVRSRQVFTRSTLSVVHDLTFSFKNRRTSACMTCTPAQRSPKDGYSTFVCLPPSVCLSACVVRSPVCLSTLVRLSVRPCIRPRPSDGWLVMPQSLDYMRISMRQQYSCGRQTRVQNLNSRTFRQKSKTSTRKSDRLSISLSE